MKILKICFEYNCFPVWLYENGILVENDLPPELIGDQEIDPLFVDLQNRYNSLYINDGKVFQYIGFSDEKEKTRFTRDLCNAKEILQKKIGTSYIIECAIDIF